MVKHNINHEYNPKYRNYSVNKLSGDFPKLDIANTKLAPDPKSKNGHAFHIFFTKTEIEILHNFILNEGGSLFTCFITAWSILFYRYTSQRDIIIGTKLVERNSELKNQNSVTGDTLLFRAALEPFESFNSFHNRIKESRLLNYESQTSAFKQIVIDLNSNADKSRNPIFDIMITFNKSDFFDPSFTNSNKIIDHGEKVSKLDLEISFYEMEDVLYFDILYNTDVYENDMIESLIVHYKTLLFDLVAQPTINIEDIDYLSDQENHILLNVNNKPEIEFPKNKTILDLFNNQVEKTPNEIAVVFKENILTYKELDILSNQLAHYLIDEQNVTLGDYVTIIQRRTEMLIVSILGILKSGAAYVPIDPDYPQQRIDFLQNDSNCKFTLDHDVIDNFLAFKEKYHADCPSAIIVKPNDLAYIIYTSGSTGNPKGVMIEHRNLVHYLLNIGNYIDPNSSNSGCFAHLSHSFDASIQDIFLPLIFGKKLILSAGTGLEIFDDKNLLQYAPYDFINITPSHISILVSVLNKETQPKLTDKYVVGGEALYNYHINQFKSAGIEATIVNDYGPTEATVACISYEFNTFDIISTESIPIGKPIANTEIYVLDENRQLMPEGKIGEIYIAGNGIARGYLNRESLTSEKFVPNPFDIGTRMYRTGDLAQWLPDGNLLYCGRIDEQVKVNGHRIELGEIEHSLMLINSIKTAVVLAKNDILIAYIIVEGYVTKKQDLIQLWRSELESQLPTFMIPHVFQIVEKIPTTQHGKIDRKALLEYKSNLEKKLEYTAPRSEEEKIVAAIWKESLNLEQIDIFSNFFEIGGHSIIAVKIMNKLEQETGDRLPLASLFKYSTIEKFAQLLNSDSKIESDCLVPIKKSGNKIPLFIIHGAGLDVLNFVNLSKHFDEDQPIYAIQGSAKEYDKWYESIEAMAAHYVDSIVKTHPKGPYALAGFSFGGVVAFEMARQLKEKGKTVSLIGLLDTYVDPSYYYASYSRKRLVRYYDQTYRRIVFFKEMLTSLRSFKLRFNSKKNYLIKKYFGLKNIMTTEEKLALEQFTKANSMVEKIVNRYHLKPQKVEVDLFRAKDDDESYKLDPTHLGWKKIALNGVNIHNISGNHLDIIAPPNDKTLAKMLQDILDKRHKIIESYFFIFFSLITI